MSRARVWTFITYPDSLPENWTEIVEEEITVSFVVSPLHDKDILKDSEEGKNPYHPFKKPHYHNMISFSQVKSYAQVVEICKKLGAQHCEQVHSVHSMARYFIHADQKNKAQYSKKDIQAFCGADIDKMLTVNDKERYKLINDMMQCIDDNGIEEFFDFVNYARINEFDTWFPLLCDSNAFLISNYIKSARNKSQRQRE